MPDLIPLALRNCLESGEVVLFLGAGIGRYLVDNSGLPAPDAGQLGRELAEEIGLQPAATIGLDQIAQLVEIRKGRAFLDRFLTLRLRDLTPLAPLNWLPTLRWRAIFTTNYDRGIETTYDRAASPMQNPVSVSATSGVVPWNIGLQVPVIHLHGVIDDPAKSRFLITQDDYVRYAERRRMLFEMLKQHFATAPILYLGYSNRDDDWRRTFEELAQEFFPSLTPLSYRLARNTDAISREILSSKRIETLDGSLDDFVAEATAVCLPQPTTTVVLERLRAKVPAGLAELFDRNPAATIRLVEAWEFVNEADWSAVPNTAAYLQGDQPTWALVGSGIPFERDISELVVDDVLDYLTSGSKVPRAALVTGSAGYGMTTVIMTAAARLVKERAGPVFWHRPTAPLLGGDVEFAASAFPEVPIFVIDNVARFHRPVAEALDRMRNERVPALFVLGERLNEWRLARARIRPAEHLLERLSDAEIDRLLEFLASHHALNKLEDLEPALRIAAIREKDEKQLLVAMKEATEGMPFDAIIESEFRNLPVGPARELYAVVSCTFSLREYLRDRIAAAVVGKGLAELHSVTRDATEGVVLWELADASVGEYAARTRHQVIADIVWERCVSAGEREAIVLGLLAELNVTAELDRRVFDALVQSDRHVDGIGSFEAKTRFFEIACRKQPDNPYVRQHYARMLLRADRPTAALAQIDQAIEMGPQARILQHTKGKVLAHLAVTADGLEVGRRFLTRSEAAYRASRGTSRDSYGYHGLAELYLDWARRPSVPADEKLAYIEKAEEVINDGLRQGVDKESLLIVSSRIQQWLGDEPGALAALERAVAANPGGSVARYLLGRSYIKAGSADKAIDVLRPVIEGDPNEYRACSVYADALIARGDPFAKAVAVLRLGSLFGMTDPRFVARLGGLLFADGDFAGAAEVFRQGRERGFSQSDIRRNEVPVPSQAGRREPLRLKGKISRVSVGYSWIVVPDYAEPVFCPGAKFGGVVMRRGLDVVFELVSTAVGPIARNVTLPDSSEA